MIRSVRLDDETNELLERAARESGESPSEVIRRAIREVSRKRLPKSSGQSVYERFEHLIGSFDSGKGKAAELRRRRTPASESGRVAAEAIAKKFEKRQRARKKRT
ncbi:MAG: ribbon-helix-helix protein, CopG family [Phycisphaeraceae bacterium]|nr:ribbon-helix-helix protein, CopG family [Phycisphaeraceae bacterium]MBX3405196.1 ribbon-helix-helix protein, CopG family [Phycisphaeraceae bacterium]